MIRNTLTWKERLDHLRGSKVLLHLDAYDAPLAAIRQQGIALQSLDEAELTARFRELIQARRQGTPADQLLVPSFALACEVSSRALGLAPYDVQVVAALAMAEGNVVEMQTGEGKTLAAVLVASWRALDGGGVHVLTFNDYLAERDARWMGPIYERLGLSVGHVQDGMDNTLRRRAYAADITYVTAKEAGFDLLRDLLADATDDLVHRPFHCAVVDEADSLMIDEARVPLVIAGAVDSGSSTARHLAEVIRQLEPETHYGTDEYGRNVELTETGFDRVEEILERGNLLDAANYSLLTELNCALHAHVLLRKDVDYIVRNGRLELVDEHTGRVVDDRQWPDGLQAALEAKEGVAPSGDGRILGSITLQHFLRGYPELCGMTGTARDAAQEIEDLYGLGVVVVPTHRPMIRIDQPDEIFTHREARDTALIDEIRRAHAIDRPVLVGTASVEESEHLAEKLVALGLPHQVLNARHDAHEAEIVAQAGQPGAVTLATNMAGRGTDIGLGEGVADLGGLYVLSSHHHDSHRVDKQLRGRAGRQGDPGESRTYVALDDPLLERYGVRNLIPPSLWPKPQSEPLRHPVIRREIDRAQRIVEGQNLEIRKTLAKYAEPIEDQRQILHAWRQQLLLGEIDPELWQQQGESYRRQVEEHSTEAVQRVERLVTLHHIDRAWSEHLTLVADLREGNHLVGLAGEDPLTRFRIETAEAFRQLQNTVEDRVVADWKERQLEDGTLDLDNLGLKRPAATWTYLINDDPFRDQLGMMLTGPGKSSMTIGAALVAPVFLILWALVDKYYRRRPNPQPNRRPEEPR